MRKETESKLKKYGISTGDMVIFVAVIVLSAGILAVALGTKHLSRTEPELLSSVSGNAAQSPPEAVSTENEEATAAEEETAEETAPEATEAEQAAASPVVEQRLSEMTLEEKIYQLFIVTPEVLVSNAVPSVTETGDTTRSALREKPVGGLIYFSQNLESGEQTSLMISGVQDCMAENGSVGLWIAVDEEGGKIARVADKLGTTSYSPMAVYGAAQDIAEIEEIGADIAEDIAQFGFNLDFAPVADVDIDPDNELGDRIFSDDPQVVSAMAGAMVKGLQSTGRVSATLKHFPGLGAENGNTHDDAAAYIDRTLDELRTQEFVGFQGGIDAGADFVMVGHQIMSCAGDDLPADLSPVVVTDWLRDELGFEGIIITDAHNMNTISGTYSAGTAAKMAVEAGVDIVLMPTDLEAAFAELKSAAESDPAFEERINESVKRILSVKEKHGLL